MKQLFKAYLLSSAVILFSLCEYSSAQELPIGYISYYQNLANSSNFLQALTYSSTANWEISKDKLYTRLGTSKTDSIQNYSIPVSKGAITPEIFGEFIAEFDFRIAQTPQSDTGGFYFLAPMKSCNTYYAFNFRKDSVAFYFIENGLKQHIGTEALAVKINQWNKVRIERDMLSRTMIIGLKNERITFSDRKLVIGTVGFGTQNVNSHIRNIGIWAPTVITDKIFKCE